MLCQYKNIFGIPREGFHKARIPFVDMALWDTLGTVAIIALITYFSGVSWIIVSLSVIMLAVFLHSIFCVPTQLEKYLPVVLMLGVVVILFTRLKEENTN